LSDIGHSHGRAIKASSVLHYETGLGLENLWREKKALGRYGNSPSSRVLEGKVRARYRVQSRILKIFVWDCRSKSVYAHRLLASYGYITRQNSARKPLKGEEGSLEDMVNPFHP
jgi:hypothetical protein